MSDDEMEIVEEMSKRIAADPADVAAHLAQAQAYFKLEEYEASARSIAAGLQQCGSSDEHVKLRKKLELWQRKCDTHLTGSDVVAPAAEKPAAPAPPPKPAIRQDWFQSHGAVTVSLFVKNRTADDVTVDVDARRIKVAIKMADGKTAEWVADPLFGDVVVESLKVTVKSMKIELQLTKREQGSWDKLVGAQLLDAKPAAYPTSNKRGTDWAKVSLEEEEEKPEGDAALNKLFQDIYGRGDPETKKAMIKSFTESAGTVLSTNWGEVGAKKVEGTPPSGMEMKSWQNHEHQDHS